MTEELTAAAPPVLHPHAVHIEGPRYETDTEKVQTFDPAWAPKGAKPDGENVIPAKWAIRPRDDGTIEVVAEVPEIREPYWLIDHPSRHYLGPSACPDCSPLAGTVIEGRDGPEPFPGPFGLSSRGWDFVCMRLGNAESTKACHEGCIVACGIER